MTKINWRVRLRNPQFIAQIAISIFVPILGYAGLTAQDLTSWAILLDLIIDAISNPYVLMIVAVSVYNAIQDPTTSGITDSMQALTYDKPRKDV
ncbi:phage holin [Marinilactibacillus psychrotolerans]|uniref:phage holin n=1 Tax=Marinilactibacillus psychrotolerans TaxID=191770 RepID=UPI001BB22CEA|nr:phage holin [Marinilactibacillus psychrotolerans]